MARRRIQHDPNDTDVEQEIKELEARAKDALQEIAELADEEEDERIAEELRQKVEELEAELAQRKQQQGKNQ